MSLKNCLLLSFFILLTGLAIDVSSMKAEENIDDTNILTMYFEDAGLNQSENFYFQNDTGNDIQYSFNILYKACNSMLFSELFGIKTSTRLSETKNMVFPRFLVAFHNLAPPESV